MSPRIIGVLGGLIVIIIAVMILGGPQGISERLQAGFENLFSQTSNLFPQYGYDSKGNMIIYNPYNFPIYLNLSGKYYAVPPQEKIVINYQDLENVKYMTIKFLNTSITLRLTP